MAILDDVKRALGITGDEWNSDISDLIDASLIDMGLAGVDGENVVETNPLVKQAIKTYCRMNFSVFGLPDDYDGLKRSYDEQKAQMSMASYYTEWGDE